MVSSNCGVILFSILVAYCAADSLRKSSEVPKSSLWQPSSLEDPLPQTFHVKHQSSPGSIDALGARVLARRNAIARTPSSLPRSAAQSPSKPVHSPSKGNIKKEESASAYVAQRLQDQEEHVKRIIETAEPRKSTEIAKADSRSRKSQEASSTSMKTATPSTPLKTIAQGVSDHIKKVDEVLSNEHAIPQHHIAREPRSVETVPGASSASKSVEPAQGTNASNITDAPVAPDLGNAIKQIIAINGTINLALGTARGSTTRKSESLCGIVEIEHLEVCTWFKQYEASLKPAQLIEFEEQSPGFHGPDSEMLVICNRLYEHTCIADPTSVCDQATACSYVPVCNAFKDMKPAPPSGTILQTCPAEPNTAVKELWGGEIPDLIPMPPADDGVEEGQRLVKMMLKGPSKPVNPHSNSSAATSEDQDDIDEEQAVYDIEDEDAADEAGTQTPAAKEHHAKPTVSPPNVKKSTESPAPNAKAMRAALRKAMRDPVRGGEPAARTSTTSAAPQPAQAAPQRMSVSKEYEQAEAAIKNAMTGVADRAAAAANHHVVTPPHAEAKREGPASSGSKNGTWAEANIDALEDMTSFWNKVTDSAAAALKNADATTTSSSTTSTTVSTTSYVTVSTTSNATSTTKRAMLNTKTTSTTSTTTTAGTTTTTTTGILTTTTVTAANATVTATTATMTLTNATNTTKAASTIINTNATISAVATPKLTFDAKKPADANHTQKLTSNTTAEGSGSQGDHAGKTPTNATMPTANSSQTNATRQVPRKSLNFSNATSLPAKAENQTKVIVRAVSKDNASDSDAADVEVDEFAPVGLNSTGMKQKNGTANVASQSSVAPPWESANSTGFSGAGHPLPSMLWNPSIAMAIPPWLAAVPGHSHMAGGQMLNAKQGMPEKDHEEDDSLAGSAGSTITVTKKQHTHTIRDAIKKTFNKVGHKKVVKMQGSQHLAAKTSSEQTTTRRKSSAAKRNIILKRYEKEENGGHKRHTIRDAVQKAITSKKTLTMSTAVKAAKEDEADEEGDDDQDEDDEAEDDDDEDGEDDEDDEDDDDDEEDDGEEEAMKKSTKTVMETAKKMESKKVIAKAQESTKTAKKEDDAEDEEEEDEEDDEALLQDAPWLDMPPRSSV
eukprot:gnl/MRDRNA2_/MRDRNA2_89906_c0_seq1.p1 gnl/MRDRNA2_/MRDRNA2_89906_c0~~gnl/MRDRNA2_/MRDRNA2_89906_c0_seq1.p1  ORF type:complete len:1125 (+),score=296.00 gnl/MRDRNA2_/MRDRNA2_89906_c0_seq1:119-3493(+)